MRRFVGALLFGIGVLGILLSLGGIILGWRFVNQTAHDLQAGLVLVTDSLSTVETSLRQTKVTLLTFNQGLETIVETTTEASKTAATTQAVLEHVVQVTSKDLPQLVGRLETVTLNAAEAAASIDAVLEQLQFLRAFGVEVPAAAPLSEPLKDVAVDLRALSRSLRRMANDMKATTENVEAMQENIATLSKDLAALNKNLAAFQPILDDYINIVGRLNSALQHVQANLGRYKQIAKLSIAVIMVWVALLHVTPLYLGWELVMGRRPSPVVDLTSADRNGKSEKERET